MDQGHMSSEKDREARRSRERSDSRMKEQTYGKLKK